MVGVDTNVVVRLLTADHPEQAGIARMLLAAGAIWISKTVFLETGWVLGSLYNFSDLEICNAFEMLLGLENVVVESENQIIAAITLTKDHKVEWADALHLASCPQGISFTTFDKPFAKRAMQAGVPNITSLVGSMKAPPDENN